MTTKKFLIPFVLASLAGHALVLALTTGRFDWRTSPRPEQVMTVELPERMPSPAAPARRTSPPAPTGPGLVREDSVALQDEPSRYDTYLLTIRRNIEARWSYPPQALAERKEGSTLVRFSIEANGTLSGCQVVSTSGSAALDAGTLAVVRAAAPYAPFPADFQLTRLHVTATFRYRLQD